MKRRQFLVIALALLTVAVVGVHISSAVPNAPPGVKAENWRSISADMGIAIHTNMGPTYQGPMVGTLMVRDGDRWRPVELVPGSPGAVPAR